MKRQHFPQVANGCNLAVQQYIMLVLRYAGGLISQIPQRPIYEGESILFTQMGAIEIVEQAEGNDEAFAEVPVGFHEVSGQGPIKKEDVRSIRLEAFTEMIINIAQELAKNRGRTFYSEMNAILDKAGRTYSVEGKFFTFEMLLHALEEVEVEFDERGNPILPTAVIPPAMEPVFNRVIQEASTDPEKSHAWRELLNRKREAFNAKEANRKLVD